MLDRAFGIEFEFMPGESFRYTNKYVERCIDFGAVSRALSEHALYWEMHPDCGGVEIKTRKLFNKDWPEVRKFCTMAEDVLGGGPSIALGTHVHVDVSEFAREKKQLLTSLWMFLEPAILLMVPPNRRDNRWCSPLTTGRYPYSWKGLRDATLATRYCDLPSKLAIGFSGFGTLECRLHESTLKYDTIKPWTHMLQAIVEFSSTVEGTMRLSSLDESTEPMDLLEEILASAWPEDRNKTVMRNLEARCKAHAS